MRARESTLAVLFLIPAFIALGIFLYYPIAQTFIYSLYNLRYTTELTPEAFYGLNNYLNVLNSGPFWSSLGFTLYFTVMAVFFEFWLGFAFALATFRVVPALRGALRAIIIIPWAIPPIIHAALFRWLYNTDVGLFGSILVNLGLVESPPLFLGSPSLAIHSVIFAYVWKSAAITSIFLMGGLALIPKQLEDAAKVDGARRWMRFRRITLPLMLPTILVTLLFRSIDALRVFDIIYGLTGGGPGTTTEVLSSFAYRFYFSFNQYGAGSAYAIVTFFLVMAVSMVYIRQIAPRLMFRE
jgi:ABC-type sugar transport system permease subunit